MGISQSYKQIFSGYDSFILILKYYIQFLDVWLKIKIDLLYRSLLRINRTTNKLNEDIVLISYK